MNRISQKIITTVASLLALGLLVSCGPLGDESPKGFPSPEPLTEEEHSYLQGAIDWEARSANNQARDVYRRPFQTLDFCGVKPSHNVIELWPGRGWYTEILAPYLRLHGNLTVAHFPENGVPWQRNIVNNFKITKRTNPVYSDVEVTQLGLERNVNAGGEVEFTVISDVGPANSADRILTFRNIHNWMDGNYLSEVFGAVYDTLKPGGYFCVIEHKASFGTSVARMIETGYVTEDYVKATANRLGFQFVAASPINYNRKDSHNHPKGVWTLPPSLALGEENKEKYLEIGESDRMTLLFRKPD